MVIEKIGDILISSVLMNVDSSNSGEKINDFGFYQTGESGAYIIDQDSIAVMSETTKDHSSSY